MMGSGVSGDLFSPEDDEKDGGLDVDLVGYEGPLHVLLTLARAQKVDLAHISILKLAEQYLAFIEKMEGRQLDLAADYLVMAAWLAYLKSRLLLPRPEAIDDVLPEEMAASLAFQLQRLEAMRKAGTALMERPRLYRDVWPRGETENIGAKTRSVWEISLFGLLKSYGDITRRQTMIPLDIEAADLFSVDDAIARLKAMLGHMPDWSVLTSCLPSSLNGLLLRSAVSAHFVAALELCKNGQLEIRQDGPFLPVWLKPRNRID